MRTASIRCLVALLACAGPAVALAQAVPHAVVASPDIYRVVAENNQFRVIEVTWQPGQRDKMHSHPAAAGYYLTPCSLRQVTLADSNPTPVRNIPQGLAFAQNPIEGHSVENAGSAVCKIVMFEPR